VEDEEQEQDEEDEEDEEENEDEEEHQQHQQQPQLKTGTKRSLRVRGGPWAGTGTGISDMRLTRDVHLLGPGTQRNPVADAAFVRCIDSGWTQPTAADAQKFTVSDMDAELAALRDRNGGWGGKKAAGMQVPVASTRSRSPYIKALPAATRATLDALGGWLFTVLPSSFSAEGARKDPVPTIAVLHTLNAHVERRNAFRVRPCTHARRCAAPPHARTRAAHVLV